MKRDLEKKIRDFKNYLTVPSSIILKSVPCSENSLKWVEVDVRSRRSDVEKTPLGKLLLRNGSGELNFSERR